MHLTTIRAFIMKNAGALFIIVFAAFIFLSAFLLVQQANPFQVSSLVETVAVSAYCFLIVGIAVQAWNFAKERASGGASG